MRKDRTETEAYRRQVQQFLEEDGILEHFRKASNANSSTNLNTNGGINGPLNIEVTLPEELTNLIKDKAKERIDEEKGEYNYGLLLFFLVVFGYLTYSAIEGMVYGVTSGAAIHILNAIAAHADFTPLEQTLTSPPALYDYGVAVGDTIVGAATIEGIRRLRE